MSENYCNNCGRPGHIFSGCKVPITSIGVVVFRKREDQLEYLMIRRKDTLGYIDFMRGKYSIYNKKYIMNMLVQMTVDEKEKIKGGDFDTQWLEIWGGVNGISAQYKSEENISRDKYNTLIMGVLVKDNFYNLTTLVDESSELSQWTEAEWGFPKGRRNYQEKDYECALREFSEETGYSTKSIQNVQNILPFEEIFTGSNYKSYKHKYYLMFMDVKDSIKTTGFEKSEVSKMEWKTVEKCIECIRPYNVEKKRLIANIHVALTKYTCGGKGSKMTSIGGHSVPAT